MAMGFTTKGLSDLRPLFQASSSRSFQEDGARDGAFLGYGELTPSQSALEALEKPGRFNFEFAWNDPCLSDRVLVLQISEEAGDESAGELSGCDGGGGGDGDDGRDEDWDGGGVVRRKAGFCDGMAGGEEGELEISAVQGASSSSKSRTISLNVASLVLAEKSPFFRSMWQKGGMRESLSKCPTTLKITEEEEASVLELLRLIYSGQPKPISTQPREIVSLLKAADKFLVSSCIRISVEALKHFPYTLETSLLYLGLPESLQQKLELKPLIVGARNFITEEFKDLEVAKCQEEFLTLPLHVIEMLLQGDGLTTVSEDAVFDATLTWVRSNHDCPLQREKVVAALGEHIRFAFMSGDYLLDVVAGIPEMSGDAGRNFILEALKFKAHSPDRMQHVVLTTKGHRRFTKRPGTDSVTSFYWDVHSHGLEMPTKLYVVQGILCESQRFCVGGKWFRLQFRKTKTGDTCGLYLYMDHSPYGLKGTVEVDYKFYVKRWPSGEYVVLHPSSKVLFSEAETTAWGYEEQWLPFTGCPHVNSDGYMSIRADLFLKRVSAA